LGETITAGVEQDDNTTPVKKRQAKEFLIVLRTGTKLFCCCYICTNIRVMHCNIEKFQEISRVLQNKDCTLVAVSKTKPVAAIQELYDAGQRDFGENYVQELLEKVPQLPTDIHWHFIGHLQTNKVKYIAPFVYLIHGVDSAKLLKEINKQGAKQGRIIGVLLQVHIAQEETKFGFDQAELEQLFSTQELEAMQNIEIRGFMGMASFTENKEQVKKEFGVLQSIFEQYSTRALPHTNFQVLSMGMSGDYELALEKGSNMVRIGSLLFGARK
jgi:pyridoxal phosphate enzyme (YggS family)